MFGDDLRLPDGGLLLHIGPHKTGTTAIQGALRAARPAMAEHGVVYAGTVRQHQMAALALTGARGLHGDRGADPKDWELLVRQCSEAADKRVIVSSEFFDEADDEMARKAVADLGGDRVHVVVTLRPLAKIMPSAWQQYIRNGVRKRYDVWLDGMLNQPPYDWPTPTFWKRHRHDELVERWASIVGPDRVLVLVLDDADRDGLLRRFEQIAGLPSGLLEAETGWTNRSMTAAETQFIRAINIRFQRRRWPWKVYNDLIRWGAIQAMQRRKPLADEPLITLPKWALERANEIGAAAAQRIADSGVRVVGDLAILSSVEASDDAVNVEDAPLPIAVAADAVKGMLIASGVFEPKVPEPEPELDAAARERRMLAKVPSRVLVKTLIARARRRLRR